MTSSKIKLIIMLVATASACGATLLAQSVLHLPESEPASISLDPTILIFIMIIAALAAYSLKDNLLGYFAPKGQTTQTEHLRDTWLYYTCAIKLGAQVAASDGVKHQAEFAKLQEAFGINVSKMHNLGPLYQHQFKNPEPLKEIIKPFKRRHGTGTVACETLVFGLCEVAMSDGAMHRSEFRLIAKIADLLKLKADTTTRLLYAAGFTGQTSDELPLGAKRVFGHKSGGANFTAHLKSERIQYLAMLGLGPSADIETIIRTRRTLAGKYHPDKLISQNLPPEEMERAEKMMQSINEAYAWLKENA